MPDPVADKSGFLRMYMSNHPDTLVAYAKWYGKVKEGISSAEMTAIDSKSMILTCTLKSGSKKEVRVALDPPLSGYEEVKPRLLEMKALSQEGLGMIKAPNITTFQVPEGMVAPALFVAFTWYTFLAPANSTSPLFIPANFVRSYVGVRPAELGVGFLVVAHALESLYTLSLCRKHSTGFLVAAQYIFATMIIGYPAWVSFRKRIQTARIDSVMKVE